MKILISNDDGYQAPGIVALHDALKALACYKIELHISNTFAREAFRHHSYISPAVDAVMAGLGVAAYGLAVDAIAQRLA